MGRNSLTTPFRLLWQLVAPPDRCADDAELLERFVACRDETAFAALVARHGPLVFGVCRRVLRHAQDAEDAFQAAFLVLARKAAAIRRSTSLAGWLYQVGYRIAVKSRAAAARRQQLPAEEMMTMIPSDPAADLARRELVAALDDELMRLPEKYRLPLLLCDLEGKSHVETARALGCPSGSLSQRLTRGRALLHSRLTRRGFAPALAASLGVWSAAEATAAVPPSLAAAVVAAAMRFVGVTAGGPINQPAVLLAQGALRSMTLTRLKYAVGLALVVGLLIGGTILLAGQTAPPGPADPPPSPTASVPLPQQDKKPEPVALQWKELLSIETKANYANALAFSPDNRILAFPTGNAFRFLDLQTGKETVKQPTPLGNYLALAFAGTGPGFAAVDLAGLTWWDGPGGKKLSRLDWAKTPVATAAVLSADGKTLAVGRLDGTVQIWSLGEFWDKQQPPKQPAQELKRPGARIGCLAFAPGGKRLAAGHDDGSVVVWDVVAGKKLAVFESGKAGPPDDADLDQGKDDKRPVEAMRQFAARPKGLAFAADGRAVVVIDGRKLRLIEVASQKEFCRLACDPAGKRGGTLVYAVAFTPDRKTLALGYGNGAVQLVDLTTVWEEGRPLAPDLAALSGTPAKVGTIISCLAFSPNGRALASCSDLGTLKVWEAVPR